MHHLQRERPRTVCRADHLDEIFVDGWGAKEPSGALCADPGKLRIGFGGEVERVQIVVQPENVAGVAQDDGGFGFSLGPRRDNAKVGFAFDHEDRDGGLLTDVDNAGEFPFAGIEGEGGQLVPAVAGDSAAEAEVSGCRYFEFHWWAF